MGWIVSSKYRFIFIHIPKTGGTSIAEPSYGSSRQGALIPHLGENDVINYGHIRAAGLKERMGEHWDEYFKFCFVRNPWDRLVSLYHYFLQNEEKAGSDLGLHIKACRSFREFCMSMDHLKLDAHFDEQVTYIIDYNGQPIIDFVARYESMNKDFSQICNHLGLPDISLPRYRRSKHNDYRLYYDSETKRIVEQHYENDIRLLKYAFQ